MGDHAFAGTQDDESAAGLTNGGGRCADGELGVEDPCLELGDGSPAFDDLYQHFHCHLSHFKGGLTDAGHGGVEDLGEGRVGETHERHVIGYFDVLFGKGGEAAGGELVAGGYYGVHLFGQVQQRVYSLLRLANDQTSIFTIFYQAVVEGDSVVCQGGFVAGQALLCDGQMRRDGDMRDPFKA